ncbi:glycoside hydrolase family protein [Rhizobium binae]|uniref:glycoside hydrolase family protein n=1 Tax=Rhizobium binae TaxID=1138190 RepID=UPI0035C8A6EC
MRRRQVGVSTKAYRDIVGVPTISFGGTLGVKMGDTATMGECKAMLGDALVEFAGNMRARLANPDMVTDKPFCSATRFTEGWVLISLRPYTIAPGCSRLTHLNHGGSTTKHECPDTLATEFSLRWNVSRTFGGTIVGLFALNRA